jgi:predicted HD phosphohydrolase
MDKYSSNIKIYHKYHDEISIPVMQKLVVCKHREVRVHVYIPNYFDIAVGSNLNRFSDDAKKWADLTCGVEGYRETTVAIYQEGRLFKDFGYLERRIYHQ